MIKKLRVLHCPLNCGNQPWNLSRAERKLGIQSDVAVIDGGGPFYPDHYDKNFDIKTLNLPNKFMNWSFAQTRELIKTLSLVNEFKRVNFLKWALKNYDVLHFNSGATIWDHPFFGFNYWDLAWIKRAQKKIVVTYTGDDARQKDDFVKHYGWGPYWPVYSVLDKISDFNKRARIKKMAKFAGAIFAVNPDLMRVLPNRTRFLPYANVDITQIKPQRKIKKNQKIMILHAPSNRKVKGTEYVIKTVKKLSKKYPVELVLVENLTFIEATKKYAEADIVIDQLNVGWYGGFAVEAMAYGLPVVCYLRPEDMDKYVPFQDEIPIINTYGQTLEEAIEPLIKNVKLRREIGRKGRHFVEKYHDPLKIARETIKVYRNL